MILYKNNIYLLCVLEVCENNMIRDVYDTNKVLLKSNLKDIKRIQKVLEFCGKFSIETSLSLMMINFDFLEKEDILSLFSQNMYIITLMQLTYFDKNAVLRAFCMCCICSWSYALGLTHGYQNCSHCSTILKPKLITLLLLVGGENDYI